LCYCSKYRGSLCEPGEFAEGNLASVPKASANGKFEIPTIIAPGAIDPFVTDDENHQQEVESKMLIEGKFTLQAPIQEVWNFLLEPETLASCVPGAEKMEAIDAKTYESVVKQKVGPIAVRLKFTTALTELDPPRYVKAVGRGADIGKAGTFTQETIVTLTELAQDCVEISYSSNVSLVGRLATFGERIMRAKAKEVGEAFTQNLQERLNSRIAGAAAPQ
jgi:carbon monoxide dehydrogenase subunit G